MNIGWIVDFTIKEIPTGGAELTDSFVIKAGRDLGFNIEIIRPDTFSSLDKYDLLVVSNNYSFNNEQRNLICQHKNFICYNHDAGNWLRVAKSFPQLLKKAKLNIFLSPLHRRQFQAFTMQDYIDIPPHFPFYFTDYGIPRNGRAVYAGNIHEGKGLWEIVKFAEQYPEIIIDFYYKRASHSILEKLKRLSNCNLCGFVPHEKMAEIYNKYTYLIHLPLCIDAYCRMVGEAFLCGCKLILNNRVGAKSFSWFGDYRKMRKYTLNSHYYFWEVLKKKRIICL